MGGMDECVDGWDEGLEGMRVWRAVFFAVRIETEIHEGLTEEGLLRAP